MLLSLLAVLLVNAPDKAWHVKTVNEASPKELSEKVRSELDATGLEVRDPLGEVVCTLWLRTNVPAQATAEQVKNGLSFREVPEGTLLGAIHFPKAFKDTRKQEVATGVYTLRFAVQPEIGDHAGTVPHPEFALLSPADQDTSPDTLEGKNLVKLSKAVTGGDHPAVMLLFPINPKETLTKITSKDDRFQVLQVRRLVVLDSGEKAPLVLALTVNGFSKARQ